MSATGWQDRYTGDLQLESEEHIDGLASELVRRANPSRLGDAGVHNERRFDLSRRETVAGHIDDIYTNTTRDQSTNNVQDPHTDPRRTKSAGEGRHVPSTRPLIQMYPCSSRAAPSPSPYAVRHFCLLSGVQCPVSSVQCPVSNVPERSVLQWSPARPRVDFDAM